MVLDTKKNKPSMAKNATKLDNGEKCDKIR